MFKPTKATSVKEYIYTIENNLRKNDILFLHNFIQKISKNLKSHFSYNMIGYGSFKYKNYKKEIINWPLIALASQKNYISIYICALEDGEYIAEKYKNDLGKVSTGKSCIRFKNIKDINLETLKILILKAVRNPGLGHN